MFRYGGFKLFLFKTLAGLALVFIGLFILLSIASHNPDDPGLGRLQSFGSIKNFFGQFGALTSSSLLFFFGIYSYILGSFISFIGFFLFLGITIKNIFIKFFLVLVSSVFFNHILVETFFYYTNTGIIYNALTKILENFLNNYNLPFLSSAFFKLFEVAASLLVLVLILFYVLCIVYY